MQHPRSHLPPLPPPSLPSSHRSVRLPAHSHLAQHLLVLKDPEGRHQAGYCKAQGQGRVDSLWGEASVMPNYARYRLYLMGAMPIAI